MMRFGIMAMQLNVLMQSIPQSATTGAVQTTGVPAALSAFEHAALVRFLATQGFKLIELGGDLRLFLPHTYSAASVASLAALKAELDLIYTVHLPLWSVEPSTPLAPVRLGSVEALVQNIQETQPLQPEVYVLHATGALAAEFTQMKMPESVRRLLLQQFQHGAQASIEAVLRQTGLDSRRLAVETIEFPLELTLELAEALDLSLCFDTGHVLSGFSGPVDFFDALERCLPRLAEVHLHDSPQFQPDGPLQYGRDHQRLGQGDLDLKRLLDRLETAGFDGPVVFELSVQDALASLQVVRQVRPHA